MKKNEMVKQMLKDWSYKREKDLYYIMSKDSNDNNVEKSFEEKVEELRDNFNIDLLLVYIETIKLDLQDYYREYYCLSYIDENNELHSERIIFFEEEENF